MHRQLTVTTLHAIYRQASRYVAEEDLREGFIADIVPRVAPPTQFQ